MNLQLIPGIACMGETETTLHVSGDTLIHNGVSWDLSTIPEGGEGEFDEGESPFQGAITRQNGVINATVRVVLDRNVAPNQPEDLAHWLILGAEGAVSIPALRNTEPEVE